MPNWSVFWLVALLELPASSCLVQNLHVSKSTIRLSWPHYTINKVSSFQESLGALPYGLSLTLPKALRQFSRAVSGYSWSLLSDWHPILKVEYWSVVMDLMFVVPQNSYVEIPIPKGMVVRGAACEMCLHHDDAVHMNGIIVLIRRPCRVLAPSTWETRASSKQSVTQKKAFCKPEHSSTLILDFYPLELWDKCLLLLSHTVLWYFVIVTWTVWDKCGMITPGILSLPFLAWKLTLWMS